MALSNMKVFNEYLKRTTIETLAQDVEKFNASSAGAIRLTTQGIDGDFLQESFWAGLHGAQRRVDRYAANGAQASTPLAQKQYDSVKIAGGFQRLVAQVMTGAMYHKLVGQNLANAERLFQFSGVQVVDILGKAVIITDAPALYEAGTPNKQKVLSLADGAAVVMDGSDLITNIETSNGKERIETTMQADYTFGLGLKGYTWDTANGGKSPTNAELSTGTNWDLVANSIKASAGVLTIGDATK
ncbi:major capsid protein [Pseudomonas guariconensis]|uniref:major capsid protein n=1 Tax=Pseudomonas guariconensis TaxID=1288410 RepID=UPI00300CC6FD